MLPFAWADDLDIYVCMYAPTSRVEAVQIRGPDGQKKIGIFDVTWDPVLEADAFSGTVPDKVFTDTTPPIYPTQ